MIALSLSLSLSLSLQVACGLALINAMLSGTISQWEDARAQRKANGEPDDGTPFNGDDPVTPYDLAGYITFTWSQCYWALLPISSEVRVREGASERGVKGAVREEQAVSEASRQGREGGRDGGSEGRGEASPPVRGREKRGVTGPVRGGREG